MEKLVWTRLVTFFLILFSNKVISIAATVNATYPAVFAFGDSILDTGNNNNLLTATKCNFPPYGKDFYGGVATGRFGNGRVLSDLISHSIEERMEVWLPDYDVTFVDVYSPMLSLITNPFASGFLNAWNGCCGTGTFEMGAACNIYSIQCPSTASYFFWDVAHPTERAYQLTLALMLKNLNFDLTSYNISKALGRLNVTSLNLI
ncbi:GDSL esterase/lipase EXL1-like [Cicer arietinum]|uniref:GDSL esterase/lipase At5g45960-like n=1 Tax=Cicer arietinum TaxID=3827 RepID=A0A1S2Z8N4_CICAR|nr:GDSL esterase/lipase At5g45960-like [Cicer arietinum]